MYLILIDAHSKWIEVHIMNSATSSVTIEKMQSTFATYGISETLVTNNETNFTKSNGIHHT